MKEQYIKQVKKEIGFFLSRKKRNEIIRDLNEIFCSASEHNETEQQVIERLGTPNDFVENTFEQLGFTAAAPQKQRRIILCIAALLAAGVSFSIFITTQLGKVPDNVIGSADAMTNIQVEGVFAINGIQIIFVVGLIAAVIAIIQFVHLIFDSRR